MSIKAMTWAFGLPLEPRAKIALLAIADNARDDGVAWPSRDTIAKKSSQSRTTVNRRLKMLTELNVIELIERYREDGTQTTDEIRLDLSLTPEEVMRRMHALKETNGADHGGETADEADVDTPEPEGGGGCQPDTLGVHSGYPRGAVVEGGGCHSGHPQDEPSLEQDSPPYPPPGGPLSKSDKQAQEKRDALWPRFLAGYPGIGPMDQQAAKAEFDQLAIGDAEWAVSVLGPLKDDLRKANNRPPKNAHLWLRKGMFRNYPRGNLDAPPPEGIWIAEGSEQDRALRFARSLAKAVNPLVKQRPDGVPGYSHKTEVSPDLLAMLAFVGDVPLRWPLFARGSPEFAAWQKRFVAWVGRGLPLDPGKDGIRAPCQWPPKKDGTIYAAGEDGPDHDAMPREVQEPDDLA